jgi:hypothetical protein
MPKCRGFRACEVQVVNLTQSPDCVAGDAVVIAPVSSQNSLQTGNFSGISRNFARRRATRRQEMAVRQRFLLEFPTKAIRENSVKNRDFGSPIRENPVGIQRWSLPAFMGRHFVCSSLGSGPPKPRQRGQLWAICRLMRRSKKRGLFDNLIGTAKKREWNGEAKQFRGSQIDGQLDFR